MQILEFYHKDQKSPESIQRFEINTCLLRLCILAGSAEGGDKSNKNAKGDDESAPPPLAGKKTKKVRRAFSVSKLIQVY